MKNKKVTVTVGIPAYNEEANIGKLLKSILSQKQDNFVLEKIIVVSDQSTDKTDEIVKSFKDKRIKLVRTRKRSGKALNQNKMVRLSNSDILIIIDADVLPINNRVFNNLIKPFEKSENIGIVGGKVTPLPSTTFFEKILSLSTLFKQEVYESMGTRNNLYLCHGRLRAFSKDFYRTLSWQPTFGEDAFSYLYCVSRGFDFVFQKSAVVKYRLPKNLEEHKKQSTRFLQANSRQSNYFNKELVDKSYYIPRKLIMIYSLKYLAKSPILFISYLSIMVYSSIDLLRGERASHIWNISTSSKKL